MLPVLITVGTILGAGTLLSACSNNEEVRPVDPQDAVRECWLNDTELRSKELPLKEATTELGTCQILKTLDWYRENIVISSNLGIQQTREGVVCYSMEALRASPCYPENGSGKDDSLALCLSARVFLEESLQGDLGRGRYAGGETCFFDFQEETVCAWGVAFVFGPGKLKNAQENFPTPDSQEIYSECSDELAGQVGQR